MNETQFWRLINTLSQQNLDFRIHRIINKPLPKLLINSGLYADAFAYVAGAVIDLENDPSYNTRMSEHWLNNGLAVPSCGSNPHSPLPA